MKRRAEGIRDLAIAGAGICGLAAHLLAARWGTAVFAALMAMLWIVVERRNVRHADVLKTAAFLVVGALMVWRFNETRLWLSVLGIWLLVSAADLSRLAQRFPTDSPPLDQRFILLRRLRHLAILGGVTAALGVLGRVLTIQIHLPAVALLSVFVVMVTVRTIGSISGARLPGNDEDVSG